MKKQMALISLSTDLMAGPARLRTLVDALAEMGDITQVSSIYKQFRSHGTADLNFNLVMVLKLNTDRDLEEVFALLQSLEQTQPAGFGSQPEALSLLAFNQEIRMVPGQNLPNPSLHTDPLTLRCAAEVWGGYRHPVLGQTLQELVRFSDPLTQAEFFAQGRSLFSTESTT
jgi:7,8-dihydro-6-hydroxymethylpterin-pyrophosphokinase